MDFLTEDFILQNETAKKLYHEYAEKMPIFDYHCHLSPKDIAENEQFKNMTQIWLAGDHYKWRAMRANGIEERAITGDAGEFDKFAAWAKTVPSTIRNPLYHWTHMELKNPFGITGKLLNAKTAKEIWNACNEKLKSDDFRVRGILFAMNVKVICTTDDPVDNLEFHLRIKNDTNFAIKVVPTFRPDRGMEVENPAAFNGWVGKLEEVTGMEIKDFSNFLEALKKRHDYFHTMGCRISDHGIDRPYAEDYLESDIIYIFHKVRSGKSLDEPEILKFKSAIMYELALMDNDRKWTMQLHLGALRNTNSRFLSLLGRDSGFDSIGDFEMAIPLARFLDRLDAADRLPKTIIYPLNPGDNDVVASMTGNFQDGSVPGKIQFGTAWWFNDQKDGMERQIDTLSNLGLLSHF
ncbi:MAG TPA: glucuronate isomerase, partial [Spirochaetia bacterium]|nr:glucuronate isomerase [Spirochaetia bacterium]